MSATLGERLEATGQALLPQHLLSRAAGALADSEVPWLKDFLIRRFIATFGVDMTEAVSPAPDAYPSFSAFFTRALRPGARPLADDPAAVLSPADGTVSELGDISAGRLVQAKGVDYSLEALLDGDSGLAERFTDGHFITIYLSPKDYHRVHIPVDGRTAATRFVDGRLFAVKPGTVRARPGLFAENARSITVFETATGAYAQIMVGALIVGSIELVDAALTTGGLLTAGDEFGRFRMGSTVILLFERDRVRWRDDIVPGTPLRMGERIGTKPDET